MSILMYIPRDNEMGERLLLHLHNLIEDNEVEVVRLLASLTHRLRKPQFSHNIAVLLPPDKLSLEWVLELYLDHFMDNLQLVIILPKQQDELLRIAHHMTPRYLTDVSCDFSDVESVLYDLLINSCLNKMYFSEDMP